MKSSELTDHYNRLSSMDYNSSWAKLSSDIDAIKYLIRDLSGFHNIDIAYAQLKSGMNTLNYDISTLKSQLMTGILNIEPSLITDSTLLHRDELSGYPDDFIINRTMHIDSDDFSIIQSRIRFYSDWHYPAMIFRPINYDIIDCLVSNDPLYLIDSRQAILDRAATFFSDQYRSRVRYYKIDEHTNNDYLSALPDNQFGICVCYNFFNHRPLESIQKFLTEVYQKLRPGGVLCFTINDCDKKEGVELAESQYCRYTPKRLVDQYINDIGFNRIFELGPAQGPYTWIELSKPGNLTSIRGGQSLAKIVDTRPR